MSSITIAEMKRAVQTRLGLEADGIDGIKTWTALYQHHVPADERQPASERTWLVWKASTFADPADIAAFKKCKARGNSDEYCFRTGDNGIGAWGADTTTDEPQVALQRKTLAERYGSIANGKNQRVRLRYQGKEIEARVTDILGTISGALVDLNPGACREFGIKQPWMGKVEISF